MVASQLGKEQPRTREGPIEHAKNCLHTPFEFASNFFSLLRTDDITQRQIHHQVISANRHHDQDQQQSALQPEQEPQGSLPGSIQCAPGHHVRAIEQRYLYLSIKHISGSGALLTGRLKCRTSREAQRPRHPYHQGRRGHHQAWNQQGP